MRPARRLAVPKRQRLVGLATESVSSFGRGIFRGVVKYMNLQRQWILHKDMWRVDSKNWPECDGIIIGGLSLEGFESVKDRAKHFVSCSGNYDPATMPVVCLDDDAAGAMAAAHLVDRGLQQFALYCPSRAIHYSLTERPAATFTRRARGFVESLRGSGYSCFIPDIGVGFGNFLSHVHHPQLIEWLRGLPKPIGIMAVDDAHANDLAEACREAGIGVPDSVAIVGINNDDLLCESAWPPLSSVECDFMRMGFLAAKTLDQMFSGDPLARDEQLIELPPVRVHQRMSSEMLAVDNADVADAIRYIREHACDPCNVSDVLRVVPVARRTLERQFLDRMGRSLHDEVSRVRVDTAKQLLLQADLSVEDIARRCGFSTLSSFGRFFNDLTGTSPAAYRRQIFKSRQP